jgi:hypothetical protein
MLKVLTKCTLRIIYLLTCYGHYIVLGFNPSTIHVMARQLPVIESLVYSYRALVSR